jgi:putative ABC transport system permease protein
VSQERGPRALRFARSIVRAIGRLVPGPQRQEWLEEWEGELYAHAHNSSRRSPGTVARALAALPDALTLLRFEWSLDVIAQDLRYALRTQSRKPFFASVVVITLALGIGANVAMFSIVNAVLLKPLPFADPGRLMWVREITPRGGTFSLSPANYHSFRTENHTFEDIVSFGGTTRTLTGHGEAQRVPGLRVSAGFFRLLGVQLPLGRQFSPEDDVAGATPVTIISYGMWHRLFGGDARILGQTITLNGVGYSIIGVSPPAFEFAGRRPDVVMPWAFTEEDLSYRGSHWVSAIGRLGDESNVEAANTDLRAVAASLNDRFPETNEGWSVMVRPWHVEMTHDVRTPLLVLWGAVVLVLLIACANVSNLLLARAESRGPDLAIRAALGASRRRLLKQMLTESVLLSTLGGVAGALLAWATVRTVSAVLSGQVPRAAEISLDSTALGFTALVSVGTGLIVGLLPAIHGIGSVASALGGTRGGTGTLQRRRVRDSLVVAEITLSLMLVVGAGLLLKSFYRLSHVDPGLDPKGVLTARVSLPNAEYETATERSQFYQTLLDELRGTAGVEAAAAIGILPSSGRDQSTTISVVGREGEEYADIEFRWATPDYFRTMRIPLVAGREFTRADGPDVPAVLIVNQTFADRVFPDESPLGKRISTGWDSHPDYFEIVGVAGDVTEFGLSRRPVPTIYWPHAQTLPRADMTVILRTRGDPRSVLPVVKQAVSALDANLPLFGVAPMEELLADSVASHRFTTTLLLVFAAVALVLGTVGTYGVMSYTVTQRTREIGVRVALGADHHGVLRLVLKQGMTLAVIGIAAGTLGAFALRHVITSLLYEVSPADPVTYASVASLLAVVALLACWLPARRAASIDTPEALRAE